MKLTVEGVAAVFAVPPHYIGARPEPDSREAAARELIAYYRALGVETPTGFDADVDTVLMADALWWMGLIDEARELLRPLRRPR